MVAGVKQHPIDRAVARNLDSACNFINAEIRRTRLKVLGAFGISVLVAFAVGAFAYRYGFRAFWPLPVLVVCVTGAYWGYAHHKLAETYKHIVVERVVEALGRGLSYSPGPVLWTDFLRPLDLFAERPDRVIAEDEIRGIKGAVAWTVCECEATRERKTGTRNPQRLMIFRGVLIRLDFNKNFLRHTVVVPDKDVKMLGLFGESETHARKAIARMESVEFEKCFSVYCDDQQEARYLLTPKLMELLLHANARMGGGLRASFLDNQLAIALPQRKDRFDVNIFSTVQPQTILGDLEDVVGFAEQLVETLELETRIWSRV